MAAYIESNKQLPKKAVPVSDIKFFDVDQEEKILVVGIFGKSEFIDKGCKAQEFDSFIGRTVFQTHDPPDLDKELLSLIECYLDPNSHILFLHLRSFDDAYHFKKFVEEEKTTNSPKMDFVTRLANYEYQRSRALLYLFLMTHVVIVSNPVPTFPISYLHLFRVLENARRMLAPRISEVWKEVPGITKDSVKQSRFAVPRLLFLYETCPAEFFDNDALLFDDSFVTQDVKKMQHNMEDTIYHLLRKSRNLGNSGSTSLFAIPANQDFIYIQSKSREQLDQLQCTVYRIIKHPNLHAQCPEEIGQSFHDFLMEHIEMGFSKGFHDFNAHHPQSAFFELPSANSWANASEKVFSMLLGKGKESRGRQVHRVLTFLKSSFDGTLRYCETRCRKILPMAISAYQENLPLHYTRLYHETKVVHATSVMLQYIRGPLSDSYISSLQTECEKYWNSGHRICEVLSLTGNPCTQPLHQATDEEEPNEDIETAYKNEELVTRPHSSGVCHISACNCGRRQGPREDPFVLRTANCDFYAALGADCCDHLNHITFPTYQPSVKVGAGDASSKSSKKEDETNTFKSKPNTTAQNLVASLGIKTLTQSVHSTSEKSDSEPNSILESLAGMPRLDSPAGVLPLFPSWSLVCLGLSSVYTHLHGLADQPGFLTGTGYLLPWDVTVPLKTASENKKYMENVWPTVGDHLNMSTRRHTVKSCRMKNDLSEIMVKIFIGVEYECPKGHRFMCSAPDRILRTVNGFVRDSASKIAKLDMPLFITCPCRNMKPLIAQLMRIHVVTPKAPVNVTLDPKVQPAPSPCSTFTTGCEQPMKLTQSSYWVLRLPYIYFGDNGAILSPREPVPLHYGKLLAGTFAVEHAPDWL